jgi:integration host factor subunit beta
MTRTELIERLAMAQPQLKREDVEFAVKTILGQMREALAHGERIEIRGFGAFSVRRRRSRIGRNPLTGDPVALPDRHVPHFKAGKELRERVNLHAEGTT